MITQAFSAVPEEHRFSFGKCRQPSGGVKSRDTIEEDGCITYIYDKEVNGN
jgi:hypothetical protein